VNVRRFRVLLSTISGHSNEQAVQKCAAFLLQFIAAFDSPKHERLAVCHINNFERHFLIMFLVNILLNRISHDTQVATVYRLLFTEQNVT